VLVGGVVPEVDAPDGSGWLRLEDAGWVCLGLVPDVDKVGELEEVEPLELVSGGVTGASGGTGGATGGAGFVGGGIVLANIDPNGCSHGMDVELYWNSGTVSSSPVRNR